MKQILIFYLCLSYISCNRKVVIIPNSQNLDSKRSYTEQDSIVYNYVVDSSIVTLSNLFEKVAAIDTIGLSADQIQQKVVEKLEISKKSLNVMTKAFLLEVKLKPNYFSGLRGPYPTFYINKHRKRVARFNKTFKYKDINSQLIPVIADIDVFEIKPIKKHGKKYKYYIRIENLSRESNYIIFSYVFLIENWIEENPR